MTDPGEALIDYNSVIMHVKDIPDAAMRVLMGVGHGLPPYEGRSVIAVEGRTWVTTPDVCTYGSLNWEWILDDTVLVCPKCGLDGT